MVHENYPNSLADTMKLLTLGNTKTMKGETAGYMTFILHLAPHWQSGYNACPMASRGCSFACLNTAGMGGITKIGEVTNPVQAARVRRTRMFFEERDAFMAMLASDIRAGIRYATARGFTPAFRLNGTSDIRWETVRVGEYRSIMDMFGDAIFYDYTKISNRRDLPANYHLTFSRSESNDAETRRAIAHGMNVAIVFRKNGPKIKKHYTLEERLLAKAKREAQMAKRDPRRVKVSRPRITDLSWVPTSYLGLPTFNGDASDLRFLDPSGVIVALLAKGEAKYDTSGFVVDVYPE